jgi:hypothetical protein
VNKANKNKSMKSIDQISRRTIARRRMAILQKLFPEGIRKEKIWQWLVGCLSPGVHEQVSLERLEIVVAQTLKLKPRIKRAFPTVEGQWAIICFGDIEVQQNITRATWRFSGSHELWGRNATIVLHGLTAEKILLDWAAQAVITMLLWYVRAKVHTTAQPDWRAG